MSLRFLRAEFLHQQGSGTYILPVPHKLPSSRDVFPGHCGAPGLEAYSPPLPSRPPFLSVSHRFLLCQSALSLDIMCNSVYTDVMQTIGVADPTLPQQPIPMQVGDGSGFPLFLANSLPNISNTSPAEQKSMNTPIHVHTHEISVSILCADDLYNMSCAFAHEPVFVQAIARAYLRSRFLH